MHQYRSHTCNDLSGTEGGTTVRLSGWVHRIRNHGGVLFIDLRDHYGITQCVCDTTDEVFEAAEQVKSEWVIRIDGVVRSREPDAINKELATGEIEVHVATLTVLSKAAELPVPVFGDQEYPEELRLRYRYLDLRRARMQKNMLLRSRIIASIRHRLTALGFNEFQTPILTASSPEGARDFLVPSRMHHGKFYALPQAPQQFKQLIMMSGFDRYFQIAPCFRDEDARADRTPGEFYQLDLEMSFVDQNDVFEVVEQVMYPLFSEFATDMHVVPDFPRITYARALEVYGTDKPDLRNPLLISDLSTLFGDPMCQFSAFKSVVANGGVVKAVPAPEAGGKPRSFFDKINKWARDEMSAPGLGYVIFYEEDGKLAARGPIAKFLSESEIEHICETCDLKAGDAVFFAAGSTSDAVRLAGAARIHIAQQLEIGDEKEFRFCWITDMPMFEWSEEKNGYDFSHNPFSMPQVAIEELDHVNPLEINAYQYDLVCNGIELSSGAIRNHLPEYMRKLFAIAGYDESVLQNKFGGMLDAMSFGAPPHGGIAPGIDRIVMMLAQEQNLREVVMFPMNQRAEDLLMRAPSEVSQEQLDELAISIVPRPDDDASDDAS